MLSCARMELDSQGCLFLTIVVRLPEPEPRCIALGCIGQRNVDKEDICSLGEVKLIYQVPSDATVDRILQQDGMRPLGGAWRRKDMDLCSLKSSKFKNASSIINKIMLL